MTLMTFIGSILGLWLFIVFVAYFWVLILLTGLIALAFVSNQYGSLAGAIHDDVFWFGMAMIGIGLLRPIYEFLPEKKISRKPTSNARDDDLS